MPTILIVGATRGIGLELARTYAADGHSVIGTARDMKAASKLDALAAANRNVRIEPLDIGNPASIDAAAKAIGDIPIDVVLVVAGVLGGQHQSLDDLDIAEWHRVLDIHTIGPTLVARAFKRNLVASGNGKLVLFSSQVGASTWPYGGLYIYATTKAALGKSGKIIAMDWQNDPVTVIVLHPGYVQTEMSGPSADIPVEESVSGIRKVVAKITKADSGKFYKWNGDIHPW
jgi:NAD(P)-dependent dehydrogenase (short-subunit alcohol dehydrogenase family)